MFIYQSQQKLNPSKELCLWNPSVIQCVQSASQKKKKHGSLNVVVEHMLRCCEVQINVSPFCLQTGPGEARGSVHPVVGPSLQPAAPEEQQPLSQQPSPQSCQLRWLYTFRCVTQRYCVVLHYVAGRPVVFHSAPLLSYVVSLLPGGGGGTGGEERSCGCELFNFFVSSRISYQNVPIRVVAVT